MEKHLHRADAPQTDRHASEAGSERHHGTPCDGDVLTSVAPDVLAEVRRMLIEQETAYQQDAAQGSYSSLWAHSARVARIAHHIAKLEGCEEIPALLAGLLHDTGKFPHGRHHADDTPEEEHAVRFVKRILADSAYAPWIPQINAAIRSTYLDGEVTSDLGRVVYDADCLDKLGHLGVAQFFAKQALRLRFLDSDAVIRTSVELTYAYHAPDMLKTATGRSLARVRADRTRRYYTGLVEEWSEVGLGAFTVQEQDIAGIVCVLVIPDACSCGGSMGFESDIRDAVKCRSVVVTYRCAQCGLEKRFSFCLPNLPGLPPINGNHGMG